MSGRVWYGDQKSTSQGIVDANISFVTNNITDPVVSLFRGCGGISGADSAGGANSGPAVVTSITRSGVGAFLLTLADGWRFVQTALPKIEDAADSADVRVGTVSNEGSGNTGTPVTIVLQVRNMATGAALETTGRRISVRLALKNSGNGA